MRTLFLVALLISNFAYAKNINKKIEFATPRLLEKAQNLHLTTIDGRLVGKSEGAWKHSVYLQVFSKGRYKGACSGTIIARDAVLTAAHCVPKEIDKVEIYFGYSSVGNKYIKKTASDGIATPFQRWNETLSMSVPEPSGKNDRPYLKYDKVWNERFIEYFNSLLELDFRDEYDDFFDELSETDIALIFFKGGIPKGFTPARFYHGEIPDLYESVYSYGYGIATRDLNKNTSQLRESKGKVFSYYISDNEFHSLMAYSGSNSGNVCAGDSGGGTYFKNKNDPELKLIAITNTSINNCASGSGHLMVYRYIPWMEKALVRYRGSKEL